MDLSRLAQIEKKLITRHKRGRYQLKRTSHKAKHFLEKGFLDLHTLRQRSSQILAGIGLAGSLLTTPLPTLAPTPTPIGLETNQTTQDRLRSALQKVTPHSPTKLDPQQASEIESVINEELHIPVRAVLEGQQLNHQVGFVGYEQHLKRFPGDDISLHDEEQIADIAPGLGAWGYFAKSRDSFTTEDYLREKYYSVAQTLYLPDWDTNFRYLRDWYKYRKILIVNPTNGKAVVTVLADAGPAQWTGKQFGASPESMQALNLHKGPRKGLVIFLFVDDPENKIPLGPVDKPININ